jgi:O-acetyl-ADP-ribose deacetylase (regulator of RNase III)
VLTTGGDLAKFVIHTVGPIYGRNKDDEATLLASVTRIHHLASENRLATIVSFDFYRCLRLSSRQAAAISSKAIANSMAGCNNIEQVRLVFFQ